MRKKIFFLGSDPQALRTLGTSNGFTLLEIIIAVAILASSFLALLSAQGSSFLASERARTLTQATLLAQQKMAEIQIEFAEDEAKNKFPEEDVEKTGEFDEPFQGYRWKLTVKKVEIPLAEGGGGEEAAALVATYIKNVMEQISKNVREVQLTVFWGGADKPEEEQPRLTVTTHVVKLK